MNGAERLLRTAAEAGISTCFSNPGTTELDIVAALDRVEGIRPVLGLAEGVVTGAADGYSRVAGSPAMTLLHLGPGLANGVANLHNARRAHSPVVNVVGDHATWHGPSDPLLASDIEAIAGVVSKAVLRPRGSADCERVMLEGVESTLSPPCGVVTIIVPQDVAWSDVPAECVDRLSTSSSSITVRERRSRGERPASEVVEQVANRLTSSSGAAAILLGGVVRRAELQQAAAIASATGARLIVERFPAVLEQGRGVPSAELLPYFPKDVRAALADVQTLVCAGARPPVAFFGYRDEGPGDLTSPSCEVRSLCPPGERTFDSLVALRECLSAPKVRVPERGPIAVPTSNKLDARSACIIIAALLPADAVLVNESITSGAGFAGSAQSARPHEMLSLTGGAIGQGLACAAGAAVAAPRRKVVALQADGAGLYTIQALWTMAREGLSVITVIFANGRYQILQDEMRSLDIAGPAPYAESLTTLEPPRLDWVALANGFGVPAARTTNATEFRRELSRAIHIEGPHVIEAVI